MLPDAEGEPLSSAACSCEDGIGNDLTCSRLLGVTSFFAGSNHLFIQPKRRDTAPSGSEYLTSEVPLPTSEATGSFAAPTPGINIIEAVRRPANAEGIGLNFVAILDSSILGECA
jgi:hypothetical protein